MVLLQDYFAILEASKAAIVDTLRVVKFFEFIEYVLDCVAMADQNAHITLLRLFFILSEHIHYAVTIWFAFLRKVDFVSGTVN